MGNAAIDEEQERHLDLERYVPAYLTHLANKLSGGASALYRREFGVGINDWRVLSQLGIEPWMTANRICQVVGLDKAAVSRSIGFLEGRGLVTVRQDGGDARRRRVALTRTGQALHDRMLVVALERERRLLSCLDAGERATLIRLLHRLHENLVELDRPYAVPPGPRVRRGA